jgi:hypothetical protein
VHGDLLDKSHTKPSIESSPATSYPDCTDGFPKAHKMLRIVPAAGLLIPPYDFQRISDNLRGCTSYSSHGEIQAMTIVFSKFRCKMLMRLGFECLPDHENPPAIGNRSKERYRKAAVEVQESEREARGLVVYRMYCVPDRALIWGQKSCLQCHSYANDFERIREG